MPKGVYQHKKGYKRGPMPEEQKLKLSASLIGRSVWNKGIKTGPNPEHSERMKGRVSWNKGKKLGPLSDEHKKKMSEAQKRIGNRPPSPKGRIPSPESIEKGASKRRGKPLLALRGSRNNLWKGGITPINAKIRTSIEYKNWRREVFKKDNYTCVMCGQRGGNKEADHIKSFSAYPELRFEVSNGRTLCRPCHKTTPNFGRKARWLN